MLEWLQNVVQEPKFSLHYMMIFSSLTIHEVSGYHIPKDDLVDVSTFMKVQQVHDNYGLP